MAEASLYERLTIPDAKREISVSPAEAAFLQSLVRREGSRKTLEVGFAYGCSAAHIMTATGQPHVAIDPHPQKWDDLGRRNLAKLGLAEYLELHEGFSYQVLPQLLRDGRSFDFIFIDGDHKFDFVLVDFFFGDKILQAGGCLVLHDVWMRAIQLVTGFIETNKPNYRCESGGPDNMRIYRKAAMEDGRRWMDFREFYSLRAWAYGRLSSLMRAASTLHSRSF